MGLILGQSTLSRQYQAVIVNFTVANMTDVVVASGQIKSIRVPVNAVRILTIGHLDKLHSHLTLQFNGHFPGRPGLAGTRMSPIWILLELRMMEAVVVTTGATRRAQLQSNRHQQHTNTEHFTGRMSFLSPNQQCQSNG